MATTFVRAANPIWFMVDLVGQPLNDEYYIFFLQNVFPYLPQSVYSDVNGTIPWSNPLQFQPDGTLPDNLYFNGDLVYRLEVRHGDSQSDALIREVNNFVPSNGGSGRETTSSFTTDNQISNPQFYQINFMSPLDITTEGTYNIAPDWDFVCEGVGTAEISQLISVSDQDQINNPPYALRIDTNGFTTSKLVQRFNHNGALWASTDDQEGFISMSVTATSSDNYEISLLYVPSNTAISYDPIASGTISGGDFQVLDGTLLLPVSDNTDTSDDAYIDMVIQLQGTGIIEISNVQVIGQSLPSGSTVPDPATYQQETIERNTDHLFNYYYPKLSYKQIPSYLVGWDFPLNPAQFFGPTVTARNTGVNASFYAWDQTIVFQSVNQSCTITRGTAGEFSLNAILDGQFAIIQYLDATQTKKLLNQPFSINISAFTEQTNGLPITVSVWYSTDSSLPSIGSGADSIVATLDSNGKPATFNGNWTEIKTLNGQTLTTTIEQSSSGPESFFDYGFSGYRLLDDVLSGPDAFFAIVIGTSTLTTVNSLHLNSVGLCAGDIPSRPAPQTFDEVLRQCQYFYEKSYNPDTVPGTATANSALSYSQVGEASGVSTFFHPTSFTIFYKSTKRVTPTITFYAQFTGSAGNLSAQVCSTNYTSRTIANYSISNYDARSLGVNNAWFEAKANAATGPSCGGTAGPNVGYVTFHYVADARLGK